MGHTQDIIKMRQAIEILQSLEATYTLDIQREIQQRIIEKQIEEEYEKTSPVLPE